MRKFLAGLGFRTNEPTFAVGDETSAFVTGYNEGTPVVRIGDTVLKLAGADVETDVKVRLRVTAFDETTATGEAELLSVVGDGAF